MCSAFLCCAADADAAGAPVRTHTLHQKIPVLTANLPLREPLMEAAGYRVLAADHAAVGDDDGDIDVSGSELISHDGFVSDLFMSS